MTGESDEQRNEGFGRPLAVLIATLAALFGLWALVWYNVPRDISRPMVISPPPSLAPQPTLSDLQADPTTSGAGAPSAHSPTPAEKDQ